MHGGVITKGKWRHRESEGREKGRVEERKKEESEEREEERKRTRERKRKENERQIDIKTTITTKLEIPKKESVKQKRSFLRSSACSTLFLAQSPQSCGQPVSKYPPPISPFLSTQTCIFHFPLMNPNWTSFSIPPHQNTPSKFHSFCLLVTNPQNGPHTTKTLSYQLPSECV